MKNFTCDHLSIGQAITVTTTSSYTAIDNSSTVLPCVDILIDNRGTSDVYVVTGYATPTLTATPANLRVPAGSRVIFRKNSATHLAAITNSGVSTIYVHKGEGS